MKRLPNKQKIKFIITKVIISFSCLSDKSYRIHRFDMIAAPVASLLEISSESQEII